MLLAVFFSFLFLGEAKQTTQPTPPDVRMEAYTQRVAMEDASLIDAIEYRNVGPRVMGGRVVAVQGFIDHPQTYLAAYASGGLWRTRDNGTMWEPIFDSTPSITIGNIAANPKNPDEIWLGTGEDNSSRSSYAGTGIYYTKDGGENWEHLGLVDTQHISTIVIHPEDPKTVFVSSIGRLYTTNEERGVYKTTDGGKTWEKILYINDNTGVIDLVMAPDNPDRLYAAAWERSRKAWNFVESGEGSGIYISTNGGKTWKKSNKGLPGDGHLGRIGLTVSKSNPKVLYACVDNQTPREEEEEEETDALTRRKLADMTQEDFLGLEEPVIERFLRGNNFHADITAKSLRADMKSGDANIDDVRAYLFDSNMALFDSGVVGVEVYRSDNSGKTWKKTNVESLQTLAYSYGYYFGIIEVDPNNEDTIYLGGVPLIKSTDGGRNFIGAQTPNVHVDHHAIWINPNNSNHVVIGNDGGVNMSWDAGANWQGYQYQATGQFYTVAYDMARPYRIYGGLQDNGVWRGANWEQGRYDRPWERVGGGDGAFIQVDFRDNETVYAGLQFGNYYRRNMQTGERITIYPRHQLKEDPLRYNWMTPIVLSRHHQDIFYMGSQRVMRSMDRGQTFEHISPDLTTNPSNVGDVPYGTLTMLRESPHAFGTLYAGTDDGRLWITRGDDWEEISGDMTKGLWVTGIEVSPHDEATVFVTLTGYRNDDFTTHVYMSEDYGKNWQSLKGNLPEEPCNTIRQDPKNKNILYLGTDVGAWITFDKGQTWMSLQSGMPNVPVYAMEVHPREHELIAATHGRSIYVMELDILHRMEPETFEESLVVFKGEPTRANPRLGAIPPSWFVGFSRTFEREVYYFTKDEVDAKISVYKDDLLLHQTTAESAKGIRIFGWPYRVTEQAAIDAEDADWHKGEDGHTYIKDGDFRIVIEAAGQTGEHELKITSRNRGGGRGR